MPSCLASRIPRVFFDVIFASAIAACFIPVFTEYLGEEEQAGGVQFFRKFSDGDGADHAGTERDWDSAGKYPWCCSMADGFDAETVALCTDLTRIMFPTVFFTGVAFSFVGILQSLDEFNIPALISSVNPMGLIILYFFTLNDRFGIYGLAVTFLIAWSLQALVQIPALKKQAWYFLPDPRLFSDGMRKVMVHAAACYGQRLGAAHQPGDQCAIRIPPAGWRWGVGDRPGQQPVSDCGRSVCVVDHQCDFSEVVASAGIVRRRVPSGIPCVPLFMDAFSLWGP